LARFEPDAQRDSETRLGARAAIAPQEPLTEIESRILDFMVRYLRSNTYQPSIREIGEKFGIKSTKTVSEHLQALADKGYLERDPSRSRGVRILGMDLTADTVSIPCFHALPDSAAGLRSELADLHLSLDRRLAGERGGFFVRAGGSDLAVLGVQEGDFVLVEPVNVAEVEDGSVVVARIGTGSHFHRFARNGTGIVLESLSPGGESTSVEDPDRLQLMGRVTAFYRRMDESIGALNLTHH
jgi:repressor LexA